MPMAFLWPRMLPSIDGMPASRMEKQMERLPLRLLSLFISLKMEGTAGDLHSSNSPPPQQRKWEKFLSSSGSFFFSVTCYFCVNVTSNEQCNRFAIDVPCPSGKKTSWRLALASLKATCPSHTSTGQTVCQNTHVMDHRGRTVSVDKKCSTDDACSSQVGCRQAANQTVSRCLCTPLIHRISNLSPSLPKNASRFAWDAATWITATRKWLTIIPFWF